LAKLLGIVEKLDHILYSAWIADSRPGGIGISHEASFRNPMRLFATDIGDRRRTNMTQSCSLMCDRTALVRKAGFHISFSNRDDFDLVCNGLSVDFALNVGGTPVHHTVTSGSTPSYPHGTRILNALEKPIAVPPRQSFFVELRSGTAIAARMQQIESGQVEEYAELKSILDVTMMREVQ